MRLETGVSPAATDKATIGLFALDVLACPRCGARLRVIATVQAPLAGQAILAHRTTVLTSGTGTLST